MRGFFTELKRRKVYNIAVVYAAVAWMLLEVADTVFPRIGLPDWTVTLVLALSALGFPIAVLCAWAFDMTPEGVVRTPLTIPEEHHPLSAARIAEFVGIAVLVLIVGYLYVDRLSLQRLQETAQTQGTVESANPSPGSLEQKKSIAVLPFVNMSGDPDNEYFSDGISEELLNALAGIPELKVAARTSSFYFKGKNEDIKVIGAKLGVNTLLEGSVRKFGDRVRITTQLINVADGFHLWSESYDREMKDIFAIQDEIARAIVNALKLELHITRANSLVQIGTENLEAYSWYLRGRQELDWANQESSERANRFLRKAVVADPDFADAYGLLSASLSINCIWRPFSELATGIKANFQKALELDSQQSEALAAKATYLALSDWNWVEAGKLHAKALTAKRDKSLIIAMYAAFYLSPLERLDEAIGIHEIAEKTDPLNMGIRSNHGFYLLMYGGKDKEAISLLAPFSETDHPLLLVNLAIAYDLDGNLRAFEKTVQHMTRLVDAENPDLLGVQLSLALRKDDQDKVREITATMEGLSESHFGYDFTMGDALFTLKGDIEEILNRFERAYEARNPNFISASRSYGRRSEEMRHHPRYQALLKKMNLDDKSLREIGYLK